MSVGKTMSGNLTTGGCVRKKKKKKKKKKNVMVRESDECDEIVFVKNTKVNMTHCEKHTS
jgi:hypothetical protein